MPPEFSGKWITEVSLTERNVLTLVSLVHSAYLATSGVQCVLNLEYLKKPFQMIFDQKNCKSH